ncbi:MAG: gamma-glutamylcyclotransferase [Firmicutes bacterium]|nr:gamma-glutamylcyclotransferase [Bacillota bacterium]
MKLFAYGTLMRRGRLEALVDRRLPDPVPAVLEGYRRYDTGRGYPVILEEPGASVEGLLWDLGDADLRFLDHYEGFDEDPPVYYRRTVRVRVGDREEWAEAYVGNAALFRDLAR